MDIGKVDILYSLAVREDTIENFLKRLELLPQLIQEYKCTDDNPVILSTIHSAKGLEFDTVYIIDVYDGWFPHFDREMAEKQEQIDDYEEERRIFYVAITRAKNELHLFYVDEYDSEFVDEFISSSRSDKETSVFVSKPIIPNFSPYSLFTVNTKVKHDLFGEGIIISVEERELIMRIIEVQFNQGRKIKFDLAIAVQNGVLRLVEE